MIRRKFRTYGRSGNGRQGIGILSAFYALGGEQFGKKDAERNRKAFEQYGSDLDRDWDEAKSLVGEDRHWIERHQAMSYREMLEKEPWFENRTVCNN